MIPKGILMRFLVSLLLLFLLFTSTAFSAELANLSGTIEKAREQSVLTQKIMADYIMSGMKITFHDPEQALQESIKTFEANMAALDDFATSKKAFKNIEKILKKWEPIKALLTKEKTRTAAMELYKQFDTMLALTRETTEIYTRQTGSMLGKIINSSANLGIHAQKMATLYLFKSWGNAAPIIQNDMDKSLQTFQASLKKLKKEKINTPEIQSTLKNVEKAFMYFTVMSSQENSSIPALIYKKSNAILKNANALSRLYNKSITLN